MKNLTPHIKVFGVGINGICLTSNSQHKMETRNVSRETLLKTLFISKSDHSI